MQFKKVWMSPDTQKRSSYVLRVWGGVFGIVLLMLLAVVGGMLLISALGLPREISSLLLVCAATALAALLALRVGWRSVQDAAVFILTEDDRLFAADLRAPLPCGKNLIDTARGISKTQRSLRGFAEHPFLPGNAVELLTVQKIRENRGYYAVRCRVRGADRRTLEHTYYIVKGYEDEEMLLQQLERRRKDETGPELLASRMPRYILLSALACAALIALCVLSHPAFGVLAQQIYFPCLALTVVAVFFLFYFILRYRRGE